MLHSNELAALIRKTAHDLSGVFMTLSLIRQLPKSAEADSRRQTLSNRAVGKGALLCDKLRGWAYDGDEDMRIALDFGDLVGDALALLKRESDPGDGESVTVNVEDVSLSEFQCVHGNPVELLALVLSLVRRGACMGGNVGAAVSFTVNSDDQHVRLSILFEYEQPIDSGVASPWDCLWSEDEDAARQAFRAVSDRHDATLNVQRVSDRRLACSLRLLRVNDPYAHS